MTSTSRCAVHKNYNSRANPNCDRQSSRNSSSSSSSIRTSVICSGTQRLLLYIPFLLCLGNVILLEFVFEEQQKQERQATFFSSFLVANHNNNNNNIPDTVPLLLNSKTTSTLVARPVQVPWTTTITSLKASQDFGSLDIFFSKDPTDHDGAENPPPARIILDYNHNDNNDMQHDSWVDDYVNSGDDESKHACRSTRIETKYHRPTCNHFHQLALQDLMLQNKANYLSSGSIVRVFSAVDFWDDNVYRMDKHSRNDWFTTTTPRRFIFKSIKSNLQSSGRSHPPDNDNGDTDDDDGDDDDDDTFEYSYYRQAANSAIVGAAFGVGNPLIVATLGFCGFHILTEFLPFGDMESISYDNDPYCDDGDKPTGPLNITTALAKPLQRPFNQHILTVQQKLQMCLDMAEALAVLHNHPDGSIVHGDIWLAQYILVDDKGQSGHVKLNDFNGAVFQQYHPIQQQYCDFTGGFGADYSVAPEDITKEPAGAERDVFRLADNMYSLLTGTELFPTVCSPAVKTQLLMERDERSFLDPRWKTDRSRAEAELVELIQQCWERSPKDRPAIGQVVRRLRKIYQQHMTTMKYKNMSLK